jgi:hypothetical protein
MSGCRDGKGIREFIRWDSNDNLICWQIRLCHQWVKTGMGGCGEYRTVETKTNQVTTHMPDKISWINLYGKEITIRKFLA